MSLSRLSIIPGLMRDTPVEEFELGRASLPPPPGRYFFRQRTTPTTNVKSTITRLIPASDARARPTRPAEAALRQRDDRPRDTFSPISTAAGAKDSPVKEAGADFRSPHRNSQCI